jgi:hypothetical protein
MTRSIRHGLVRRLLAALLAVGWVLGPALPSIACALANAAVAPAEHEIVPDCHRNGASETATTPSARDCCDDVTTSCCLSSLDVDGALAAVDVLSPPALAILPATADLPSPTTWRPVSNPVAPDASPPSVPLFRVLRL